jgi:predicted chitinase
MSKRSTSADFVTAFATGWPQNQPDIMVLSLTTQKGVQDFALNKEQAMLIARTMHETATRLAEPNPG